MNDASRRRDFLKLGMAGLATAGVVGAAATVDAQKAAAQSAPESLLRTVLNRGKLIVGTGSTNAPWHFENDAGELVGMDITMARILAKGLFDDPAAIEFVKQDPAQRIPNVTTGKVDITIQFMTMTAQRAQLIAFTRPYYVEGVALLTLPSAENKTFDKLLSGGSSTRVSILQNVDAENSVHAQLPQAQVMQIDTQANVIQALEVEASRRCGGRSFHGTLAGFAQSGPLLRRRQKLVQHALRRCPEAERSGLANFREPRLHHGHVRPRERSLRRGLQGLFRPGAADAENRVPGHLTSGGRVGIRPSALPRLQSAEARWVTTSTST